MMGGLTEDSIADHSEDNYTGSLAKGSDSDLHGKNVLHLGKSS